MIPPPGCSDYDYDKNKKEFICIRCYDDFVFNPENNQCLSCQGLNDTGEGCANCDFNPLKEKYECISCYYEYNSNYNGYDMYHYNYAYIKNTYQCLSNTKSEKKRIIWLSYCII